MSAAGNAMPYSGEHTDADWLSDKDQAAFEEHCKAIAFDNVQDAAWWEIMTGEDDVGIPAAACLARCMSALDLACKGDLFALNALTTALSNLQTVAKARAYSDALSEEA